MLEQLSWCSFHHAPCQCFATLSSCRGRGKSYGQDCRSTLKWRVSVSLAAQAGKYSINAETQSEAEIVSDNLPAKQRFDADPLD